MAKLAWDGGMSLSEYLKEAFLTVSNRVSWADLGGAVIGGLLYQVWAGVIQLPLAFAAAIGSAISPIVSGLEAGIGVLTGTIVGEAAAAWDPFSWGVVSLVPNIAVLLVAMFVVAKAVEVMQDG